MFDITAIIHSQELYKLYVIPLQNRIFLFSCYSLQKLINEKVLRNTSFGLPAASSGFSESEVRTMLETTGQDEKEEIEGEEEGN